VKKFRQLDGGIIQGFPRRAHDSVGGAFDLDEGVTDFSWLGIRRACAQHSENLACQRPDD
jgi:hypothetical protein